VPDAAWLFWQLPLPSHVSGLVQASSVASPHAVAAAAWFGTHAPVLSQVSGSVQAVSAFEPHIVPGLGVCTGAPASQVSVVHTLASSSMSSNGSSWGAACMSTHCVARQSPSSSGLPPATTVPAGWNTTAQVLLLQLKSAQAESVPQSSS